MRRLFQCLIVTLLILVVGGHWAFLQSVAWVSMTLEYSRDGTLMTALEKTFSGQHPCKLCKAVNEGKKAENRESIASEVAKLEFLGLAEVLAVFPPIVLDRSLTEFTLPLPRSHSPPTPPPRVG